METPQSRKPTLRSNKVGILAEVKTQTVAAVYWGGDDTWIQTTVKRKFHQK